MKQKIVYVDNFLTGHGHTPTTGTTLVKLFKQEGYTVISTSNKQNKALRLVDMLFTIIANRKNAVVLIATYSTTAFYFACACAFVCKLLNIHYIPCLHGGNLPNRIKQSPKQAVSLFAKSYMNVAVSGYLQQSMIDNGWKSEVIPNNIHFEAYPFKLRTHCKPTLLWVRSFHSIYNPLLAIYVVNSLRHKYPEARLTMVGPDKDGTLSECKALVDKLNLHQHVTFTGLLQRDEWTKLAASHDIFLNTTNFDNAPVSVVEAMALGLVVISTNVGGVPHLIKNNINGLLVPANDEAAFILSIERVINEPPLVIKLSEAARQQAEKYDWNNIKFLWSTLLNNV
jgi:glycosyltransferase involved in cell wall biosynthesis